MSQTQTTNSHIFNLTSQSGNESTNCASFSPRNYRFQTKTRNSPNTTQTPTFHFHKRNLHLTNETFTSSHFGLLSGKNPTNGSSKFKKLKKPLATCCQMRFVINSYFEAKLQFYDSTEDEDFYFDVTASIAHVASFIIEQELADEMNLFRMEKRLP